MTASRKRKPRVRRTYSLVDEMMASTTMPLPDEKRRHQLTRMWEGLRAIETAKDPTCDDWRVCSDAINLVETMLSDGTRRIDENGCAAQNWWRDCDGDWVQVKDHGGLLKEALSAMAAAGQRKIDGGSIRLTAAGIHAMRSLLEDYRDLINALPARTIIRAHRITEERIAAIYSGRRRRQDVVIDLQEAA